MKTRKSFMIVGLLAIGVFVALGSQAWAGGPENPPTTGTIVGPELWGTMTLDCSALNVVALRVKRVVDCNVETQAFVVPNTWGCPSDETTPLNRKLGVTLFGINPNPAVMDPIITKVKNFQKETGDVYSFDVQIKFWVP